ncbi:MAG: aminotransferase class I/II-fold pyridoxal phosphate-dependent enzyme [Gemmatimonadetes bacterium]|nr:aminotransferase class I/II-fold pyridoxal phosphate-dependent enzyme [Gemmatimonadota bacterium]
MARNRGVDRRAFLRTAGASALIGAVSARPGIASELASVSDPAESSQQGFDFDAIYNRVGTDSTKWDGAIATYGSKIEVGMGIADLDFRTAPCIVQALSKRMEHENWGYLRQPQRYVDAIVDWNRRRYGLVIDPATITWTSGVHPALIFALETFAPPGTRVLLATPTYNGFYSDLRYTNTLAEDSPMKLVDGRYSIDWEDFELRAARSNAFILCNPQNPTGNCWSPADLTRMGEICLRHKVVVLADEIHCDFVMKGQKYTPFASLPNRAIVDNSLTFKAASKTFNLAAMKVAWFFSTNPSLLARVRARTRADLTTPGLVANHAGLTEGEPWLEKLVGYIDGNHDFTESYIAERVPYVKYTKAQATYLAWLDVGEVVEKIGAKKTAEEESRRSVTPVTPEDVVQRWFANNAGVFLSPGAGFGAGGADHMRMNIGTSRKLIERALGNMAAALKRA